MPHDAHEFAGPEPNDLEEAWSDYALAEALARFEDLARPDQARALRDMVQIFVTPPVSDLEPEILPFLDPDPED